MESSSGHSANIILKTPIEVSSGHSANIIFEDPNSKTMAPKVIDHDVIKFREELSKDVIEKLMIDGGASVGSPSLTAATVLRMR